MAKKQWNRREFLRDSTAAVAGSALAGFFIGDARSFGSPGKRLSPNERPGIALIGAGGRGRSDANTAGNYGDVIAVCDVDERHRNKAAKELKAEHQYHNFRSLLQERDDVHVVVNGTPDHWHTLINLMAVRTGRDIYSEKPLTLTIDEGKRLVREVKRHGTVFQTGSQQRSDSNFRKACELVRNGRLGKLKHIEVGLPTGPKEGPFSAEPVPSALDWDFYQGQARWMPYNGHNAHWNFRWWYRFSGGQMTDWGAHHCDIAQWGHGTERSGPVSVNGKEIVGGMPGGYTTAVEYRVEYKYQDGVTMTVTNRADRGVRFEGSDGWIFVSRGELKASDDSLLDEPLSGDVIRLYQSDNHMKNFFDCVRDRKDPVADAEIGHRSVSVAHIGVISMRAGRPLKWDPEQEQFLGEIEANQWLSRDMRPPYDYRFIA